MYWVIYIVTISVVVHIIIFDIFQGSKYYHTVYKQSSELYTGVCYNFYTTKPCYTFAIRFPASLAYKLGFGEGAFDHYEYRSTKQSSDIYTKWLNLGYHCPNTVNLYFDKYFDTLEIQIRTSLGDFVLYNYGKCLLILHFRKIYW